MINTRAKTGFQQGGWGLKSPKKVLTNLIKVSSNTYILKMLIFPKMKYDLRWPMLIERLHGFLTYRFSNLMTNLTFLMDNFCHCLLISYFHFETWLSISKEGFSCLFLLKVYKPLFWKKKGYFWLLGQNVIYMACYFQNR